MKIKTGMRTRVKICGLTREQDIQAAVAAGADALGLVFYGPSPRYVDVKTAHKLVQCVPPFVTVVGLFVDAKRDEIEQVLQQVHIDLLQFHGNESVVECELFNKPYIKAVRVGEQTDIAAEVAKFPSASGVLLDSYQKGVPGGTGLSFDWAKIPTDLSMPVILAGGLTPDNVAGAIRQVSPYAVDVSGGVEQDKGIKDPDKINRFMQEVEGVGARRD